MFFTFPCFFVIYCTIVCCDHFYKRLRPCSTRSNYRNSDGLPRQRIIVSLGNAKLPEAEKSLIASTVERRIHGGGDFFDSSLFQEASTRVDRIVQLAVRSHAARPVPQTAVDGVITDSIKTTDVVELRAELIALKAWGELRFTPTLEALGMNTAPLPQPSSWFPTASSSH